MQKTQPKTQNKKVSDTFAIASARIVNFQGFSDVKLDDIRRINILVGDNGAGKTAFLEALFLGPGFIDSEAARTKAVKAEEQSALQGSVKLRSALLPSTS